MPYAERHMFSFLGVQRQVEVWLLWKLLPHALLDVLHTGTSNLRQIWRGGEVSKREQ